MNYAFTASIIDYFANRKISADKLVSNLNAQLMLNRDQTNQMMYNLLDSHDAPRVLSLANGDKDIVKQMYAFMFLQQGTPDIYYGSEYAMTGENDPDNRKPMEWRPEKQDHDMYAFMKDLIQLRTDQLAVLVDGDLSWRVEGDLVSFTRSLSGTRLIATFNASEAIYEVTIDEGQVIFANHLSDGILEPKGFVVILESEAV